VTFTLIVEDGSGLTNSNSYSSVSTADEYFDAGLYASTWQETLQSHRERALVQATRLLDFHVTWNGSKNDYDQALEWPRANAYDRNDWLIDHQSVPRDVRHATAEFARWLLDGRRDLESGETGRVKRVKADTVEVEFAVAEETKPDVIPKIVRRMVASYGEIVGGNISRLKRA
jgi:hypothetical protein